MELLFAKIGVLTSQAFELQKNPDIPYPSPPLLGGARLGIQGFKLASAFLKSAFPVKECASFDFEGIKGGG